MGGTSRAPQSKRLGTDDFLSIEALQSGGDLGFSQLESCRFAQIILEDARSKNPDQRLLAVSNLRKCFAFLNKHGEFQKGTNLAVCMLERGILIPIADSLRAAASKGDWTSKLGIDLKAAKRDQKAVINKVEVYAVALSCLAIDRRCVKLILRLFPDVVKVTKAIFLGAPSSAQVERVDQNFLETAKQALVRLWVCLTPSNKSIQKRLLEDTSLMQAIFQHAFDLEDSVKDSATSFHASVVLIYNCLQSKHPEVDLGALREPLLKLADRILKKSDNKRQIELGTRMLGRCLISSQREAPVPKCSSLRSSVLALIALGDLLDKETRGGVYCIAPYLFAELQDISQEDRGRKISKLFEQDQEAVRRYTELSAIFSSDAEGGLAGGRTYYVESKKAKQKTDEERDEKVDNSQGPQVPVIPRLVCRKCSRTDCQNVEPKPGIFKVCSRCKLAVYCSRDCQKIAWKGGHDKLCY